GSFRFGRPHDVAWEETDHALAIALHAEQPVALARAKQIVETLKSELALVERRIDAAQVLLHLSDVHRPPRRLVRGLEQAADLGDRLCHPRRLGRVTRGPGFSLPALFLGCGGARLRRAAFLRVTHVMSVVAQLHENVASR